MQKTATIILEDRNQSFIFGKNFMKKILPILAAFLFLALTSCQTRVVSTQKPMKDNSLELYKNYTIQTNDAKITKMQVIKIEDGVVYGKNKNGEMVTIKKEDIREVRKTDVISSVLIGAAALAAVIFVPI